MRGIKGKRFIIGGGATGMGAALAERLVEEGARVVVGDINRPALEELTNGLIIKGGDVVPVVFDLGELKSIAHLVDTCIKKFGGLDGVAIPGADLSPATLGNDFEILQMREEIWERTMQVNLIGHAHLMRLSIPHLEQAGGGSIVSVSSAGAYYGNATVPAYSASKAGLHALIRHVARVSGKKKIRCNGIAPGLVVTESARRGSVPGRLENALKEYAMHRLGEPEDIASALLFFLSDESAWITGQVLSVNGGWAFRD